MCPSGLQVWHMMGAQEAVGERMDGKSTPGGRWDLAAGQSGAELTFCLSRIFMAKWFPVSLCFTSITRPKEPVPRVLIRSN